MQDVDHSCHRIKFSFHRVRYVHTLDCTRKDGRVSFSHLLSTYLCKRFISFSSLSPPSTIYLHSLFASCNNIIMQDAHHFCHWIECSFHPVRTIWSPSCPPSVGRMFAGFFSSFIICESLSFASACLYCSSLVGSLSGKEWPLKVTLSPQKSIPHPGSRTIRIPPRNNGS